MNICWMRYSINGAAAQKRLDCVLFRWAFLIMHRCHVRSVNGLVAYLHTPFCFQTHQPVFIQLLQSAFRIYNCTWPNPAQKSSVESCIRTLAEVGKSEWRVSLAFAFHERNFFFWLMANTSRFPVYDLMRKVSLKLKSNDQQTLLNVAAYVFGRGRWFLHFFFQNFKILLFTCISNHNVIYDTLL